MTAPPALSDATKASALRELGRTRRRPLTLLILALASAAAVGAVLYLRSGGRAETNAPRFRTEAATRGTLVVTISATGNLQPTNQVDVGSELSGIVESVLVDDNDRVTKGQVLAQLDLAKLKDAVTQSRANLASAEAMVLQAEATTTEAAASLARFEKVAELSGGRVPSQAEMVASRAALQRARANEASARAAVSQAQATLQSNLTNLTKASIRSPIDGIVLSRKVEPGQTVAAAFQAPVLFTLAEDLTQMELQVDIDEADVGQVHVGQKATFGVDAWPDRRYGAVIHRVGYGSKLTDGVVTYLTVLHVDNQDLSLRPGMTGTAEITTLTRSDALLVPSAALRFTPSATPAEAPRTRSPLTALMPRMPPPARRTATPTPPAEGGRRVWVLQGGVPAAVNVKTGASNGQTVEILDGELAAGAEVITEALSSSP